LVMANAEKYYRTMSSFGESSWNTRDRHMVETLDSIMKYHDPEAKAIIWEHNTHIGDARATTMAKSGTINVGQLLREQKSEKDVVLVGFGSYEGSVIAGRNWAAPMQEMEMPRAIEGSVEEILHSAAQADQLIIFDQHPELKLFFEKWLGHRAIGVVYHPERERGNYVPTKLSSRYDAFLFIDRTTALHPMHLKPQGNLTPDTYPFGI
jgi:erythromycin esterase